MILIVYSHQSDYQDIVVTIQGKDHRLYLNGGLQYSSRDEYRYTESLVHPAISEKTKNVLVIGGGDGLAARELIGMDIHVTQVELDPEVVTRWQIQFCAKIMAVLWRIPASISLTRMHSHGCGRWRRHAFRCRDY